MAIIRLVSSRLLPRISRKEEKIFFRNLFGENPVEGIAVSMDDKAIVCGEKAIDREIQESLVRRKVEDR